MAGEMIRFSDDERFMVAYALRDWVHEQPWSECNMGVDTCPDWPKAFEIRDVALAPLERRWSGDVLIESIARLLAQFDGRFISAADWLTVGFGYRSRARRVLQTIQNVAAGNHTGGLPPRASDAS